MGLRSFFIDKNVLLREKGQLFWSILYIQIMKIHTQLCRNMSLNVAIELIFEKETVLYFPYQC